MSNSDLIAKVASLKAIYRTALRKQRDLYKLNKELDDISDNFSDVVDAIYKSLKENENDKNTNTDTV